MYSIYWLSFKTEKCHQSYQVWNNKRYLPRLMNALNIWINHKKVPIRPKGCCRSHFDQITLLLRKMKFSGFINSKQSDQALVSNLDLTAS